MYSNRLTVFVTLAQYLNFSETANQLHMAQSAVSHNLSELEKELGVKLLERTKKSCTLTPAGETFLSEAYRIIACSENAKSLMNKLSSGNGGILTIGYATTLMIDPLADCLKNFVKKYSDVELNLLTFSSVSVSRMLAEKQIDIALGRYDALIKRSDINWRFIFRDDLYVILPKEHRLAKEKSITVEMLEDETIQIVSREISPGFFDVISKLFLDNGITPILNAVSNDRLTVLLKVRIGLGVTLLTKQFVNSYSLRGLVSIPLDEKGAWFDNGIAWRRESTNPVVANFISEVDVYMESMPEEGINT